MSKHLIGSKNVWRSDADMITNSPVKFASAGKCPACDGQGQITLYDYDYPDTAPTELDCTRCNGTGIDPDL